MLVKLTHPNRLNSTAKSIPANMTRLTFCARIIDLVSDSSNCIRSSWQIKESFVEKLISVTLKNKTLSSKRRGISDQRQMLNLTNAETTNPIHEWLIERPNILFDSLEVVRLIITAHSQCVQENLYAKFNIVFNHACL